MAFIDQAELEAVKKLSSRRAPCCNKHQFCAKMTVNTYISLFEQSGRNEERKKYEKWHFCYHTLLCLAVFHVVFGHFRVLVITKALKQEVVRLLLKYFIHAHRCHPYIVISH